MGGIPTKYTGEVLTVDAVRLYSRHPSRRFAPYSSSFDIYSKVKIKLYLDYTLLEKPLAYLFTEVR